MRTHLSNNFITIAHTVGKIKWLKRLLSPINNWYVRRIRENRNKLFCENGISIFKELDELLIKHHIRYSVTYGTLLGAVREGGPISHDYDFDICLWQYDDSMREILESNGFILTRRFLVDEGRSGREETYSKNGIDIDFFYIYSDDNYPSYSCCFKPIDGCITFNQSMKEFGYICVRRLQIPISEKLVRLPFGEIEVNAMRNYIEFLETCYGKDYMIPDSNYQPIDGDNVRFLWEDKKGIACKL